MVKTIETLQVNTKDWRNALKRAGIEDFRWHDLRHTFAPWHREAGTPTHELQRLGGWKMQSMVERYAYVAPEGSQVAAVRLDALLSENRPERPSAPNVKQVRSCAEGRCHVGKDHQRVQQ